MALSLPKGKIVRNDSNDYQCEYTILRVIGSDDYGTYYLADCSQDVVDVHVEPHILKELFVPALCKRVGDMVEAKSDECKAEFNSILTAFMTKAVKYNELSCQSDNLVDIGEPFFANGTLYYSSPYPKGQVLTRYVAEHGPLKFEQVERMLRPLIEAVEMMHSNSMAHFGICPENILIQSDGDREWALLMDFDRAIESIKPRKILAPITPSPYKPPEQSSGVPSFVYEADVYALAATLYFCLSGHAPELPEVLDLDKVCDELLTLGVEAEKVNELLRALESDSDKRHSTAGKFAEALFGAPSEAEAPEPESEQAEFEPEPQPEPQPEPPAEFDAEPTANELLKPGANKSNSSFVTSWLIPIIMGIVVTLVILYYFTDLGGK